MAGGGFYGWFFLHTPVERFFSFFAGGFFGSSAGAILFIYAYFSSGSHSHVDGDDKDLQLSDNEPLPPCSAESTPKLILKSPPADHPAEPEPIPAPEPTPALLSGSSVVDNMPDPDNSSSLTGHLWKPPFFRQWQQTDSRQRRIKKLEKELRKLKQKQKKQTDNP